MSHARMKTLFLHFSDYLPWSIFLLLQLLKNLVFVEFPRFLFAFKLRFSVSNLYLIEILSVDLLRLLVCFCLMSLSLTSCDVGVISFYMFKHFKKASGGQNAVKINVFTSRSCSLVFF